MLRAAARFLAVISCVELLVFPCFAAPSWASLRPASVEGTVQSQDGSIIAGATVTLQGQASVLSATTNRSGRFEIDPVTPGQYAVSVIARGFAPLNGTMVNVAGGGHESLVLVLSLAQASSLVVLGKVTVDGGSALSTAPAPIVEVNAPSYAARAVTRVSDTLMPELSTTVVPVVGGGYNAPAVVALRGPDPSETLIAVDGHQVNNGSTGDYDLSLLDPADLQNVQVIYGIAPSSLVGPDTLGGAINIRTLEPTTSAQGLLRLTFGSYDTTGQTIQATGTDEGLGYALSYHRLTSAGELDNYAVIDDSGNQSVVGNGLDGTSTLAKLRYSLDQGAGFVGVSFRDQAAYRDISATLTSLVGYDGAGNPVYDSFAGSAVESVNQGYGLDAQLPLGHVNSAGAYATTALFRHLTSIVNQSVEGPALGTSPYLLSGRDAIDDDTLELTHPLPKGALSLKMAFTTESLQQLYSPYAVSNEDIARLALPAGTRAMQLSASTLDTSGADGTDASTTPGGRSPSITK